MGSFLNAAIYRMEKGENALKGRSYCPYCRHQLSWRDLIPLLSFALLGGRCRYCHKNISLQYPIVEIATALLFLLIFSAQGGPAPGWQFLNFFYLFAIASLLIVLFVYDLRHYILPDKILLPAIGLAFFWNLLAIRSSSSLRLSESNDLGEGWEIGNCAQARLPSLRPRG